ncbi:MAG: hypothetical protein ACOC4M_02740 [Promethearchaeia archaeon]
MTAKNNSLNEFLNNIKTELKIFNQRTDAYGSLLFNPDVNQFIIDEYTIITRNRAELSPLFSSTIVGILKYIEEIPFFTPSRKTRVIAIEGIHNVKENPFFKKQRKPIVNLYMKQIGKEGIFMTAVNAEVDQDSVKSAMNTLQDKLENYQKAIDLIKKQENKHTSVPLDSLKSLT